jgi:hypothetical protein
MKGVGAVPALGRAHLRLFSFWLEISRTLPFDRKRLRSFALEH